MATGLICSGDTMPLGFTANTTSKALISTANKDTKYLRISNLSNGYVYLAFNAPAELNKGLVLAPKGTVGWFVEFNNDNMIYGTLNAITESGTANIAILIGG
jgi:hypothetical protein